MRYSWNKTAVECGFEVQEEEGVQHYQIRVPGAPIHLIRFSTGPIGPLGADGVAALNFCRWAEGTPADLILSRHIIDTFTVDDVRVSPGADILFSSDGTFVGSERYGIVDLAGQQ